MLAQHKFSYLCKSLKLSGVNNTQPKLMGTVILQMVHFISGTAKLTKEL